MGWNLVTNFDNSQMKITTVSKSPVVLQIPVLPRFEMQDLNYTCYTVFIPHDSGSIKEIQDNAACQEASSDR